MKIQKQREIVVEFERVQLVRKRARTQLLRCRACAREVDFVSLTEAAALFSADAARLFQFVKTNFSHYELDADGEIHICLASLLARMKKSSASWPSLPS